MEHINVFIIKNIEEYGKFIAYCIEHDINVWRCYWDQLQAGRRCYCVDWLNKKVSYGSMEYLKRQGMEIIEPEFYFDNYGTIRRAYGKN